MLLERTASPRKSLMPLEGVRVSWISDDRRGMRLPTDEGSENARIFLLHFSYHRFFTFRILKFSRIVLIGILSKVLIFDRDV